MKTLVFSSESRLKDMDRYATLNIGVFEDTLNFISKKVLFLNHIFKIAVILLGDVPSLLNCYQYFLSFSKMDSFLSGYSPLCSA